MHPELYNLVMNTRMKPRVLWMVNVVCVKVYVEMRVGGFRNRNGK